MSAPFWTSARVGEALRDHLAADAPRTDAAFGTVSTDTRTLAPGALFVALRGENHDAHDHLAGAVAAGAAGLVVSDARRAGSLGVPVWVVRDTLRALGALGRHRRRAWGKKVVAVTGSNGKTSTKELLRAALGARFRVHATRGNLNNQIGVPLTLLALPDDAEIAVVEMGTSLPGEIALLRAIGEPDLAVVTSIGEAHLELLKSIDGVREEKSAIYDGVAVGVVPASEPALLAIARRKARRVVVAGLGEGDVRAARWGRDDEGGWLEVEGARIAVPLRGEHNLRNAMLAVAVARECGIPLADVARGIGAMEPPKMRLAAEPLGRATLINDAYNANPGSMRAAIDLLDGTAKGQGRQRVLVLGTMRELGAGAAALHAEIARRAVESSIDLVAGIGEFAPALRAAGDGRVVTATDVDDLWPKLRERLAPDAVILLKASRGVKLERLVPHLTAWAAESR